MVCGAYSGPWSGESQERRELASVAMSGANGAGPTGGRVSEEEKRESRRSSVRIWVTYGAAAFLFLGGAVLIGVLLLLGEHDRAVALFNAILPVSASIVAYRFAGRNPKQREGDDKGQD